MILIEPKRLPMHEALRNANLAAMEARISTSVRPENIMQTSVHPFETSRSLFTDLE